MDKLLIQSARAFLNNAQRILIVTHIRPDGDAIGSLLGLGLSLLKAGKEVQMVSVDGVPVSYRHLAGSDKIIKKADGHFDLTVAVDCSDLGRLEDSLDGSGQLDLNIDHHVTNLNFARLNLVEPDAAATTEIIARCLPEWGLQIDESVADALLTGLLADTIGFRTGNVTGTVLRVAADLVDAGANLSFLYRKALLTKTVNAARYWGSGLSDLKLENGVVWTSLTLEDRKLTGYPGRDDADLINLISFLQDAEVAIIFIEQAKNMVKVSWRSQNGKDVSQVALHFGGGGHRAAAGAEIQGTLSEVQQKVLQATRELILQEIDSDDKR